jgi:hypothetical protein
MKRFRIVTDIGTSYVIKADHMLTVQQGVVFSTDTVTNGYTQTDWVAFARMPVIVYEISSVTPDEVPDAGHH